MRPWHRLLTVAIQYLCDETGKSFGELVNILNRESGLKGLSGGLSGDSRDVEEKLKEGCPKAKLAVDAFSYRLAKYIGAYAAVPLKGREIASGGHSLGLGHTFSVGEMQFRVAEVVLLH